MFIFTYGTLKCGFPLNDYLRDQKFIGEAETEPGYILYSLGWFPGMVKSGKKSVKGELWEVFNIEVIDKAEGPFFRRTLIKLKPPYENESIEAYLYLGETIGKKCQFWRNDNV